MTIKELKRIHMIHEIQAGRMTATAAAGILGLSLRQVRRLIKRQREAGAANAEEANRVLESFLPKFKARFQVAPAQPGWVYLPWPADYRREQFICFKHTRLVTNDNTISFDGHRLQIPPGPQRRSYAHARVDVWQHLDGRLEVRYQGESLVSFQAATDAPLRVGKFTPAPGQTWSKPPGKPLAQMSPPLAQQSTTPGDAMANL